MSSIWSFYKKMKKKEFVDFEVWIISYYINFDWILVDLITINYYKVNHLINNLINLLKKMKKKRICWFEKWIISYYINFDWILVDVITINYYRVNHLNYQQFDQFIKKMKKIKKNSLIWEITYFLLH